MVTYDSLSADILIVGGGIAALRAAEAASHSEKNILIITNGTACCSSHITGFNAVLPHSRYQDRCSIYFDDTVNGGSHLNDPALVAILTYQTEAAVQELISMGVRFDMKDNRLACRQAAGSSVPRLVHYQDRIGSEIMSVLLNRVHAASNVTIVENSSLIKLFKENGVVRGALALNRESGRLLVVNAGVTILATGGIGGLYSFSSVPRDVSGDGYILAKKAGARLRDMEFVQFEPFVVVYPEEIKGMTLPTALLWDGAVITNRLGEEFIPLGEKGKPTAAMKSLLTRKIALEIRSGRGSEHGGVYLRLDRIPEDLLKNYPQVVSKLQQQGLDPQKTLFEVKPAHHYMMGGVEVDKKCKTRIPGLMAVGEVAGGLHGAGRISGNSGSEVVVFGAIAGKEAVHSAEYIGGGGILPGNISDAIDEYHDCIGGEMDEVLEARRISKEIAEIMQSNVAEIREGRLLSEALERIQALTSEIKGLRATDFHTYFDISAAYNVAEIANMVTQGALMRTESRGDHFRLDFQNRDDLNFLKSIFVKE